VFVAEAVLSGFMCTVDGNDAYEMYTRDENGEFAFNETSTTRA
jgi:hypothetical protein